LCYDTPKGVKGYCLVTKRKAIGIRIGLSQTSKEEGRSKNQPKKARSFARIRKWHQNRMSLQALGRFWRGGGMGCCDGNQNKKGEGGGDIQANEKLSDGRGPTEEKGGKPCARKRGKQVAGERKRTDPDFRIGPGDGGVQKKDDKFKKD